MTDLTMHDMTAPLRALRLLTADHPDLPALAVRMTTVYPDRLELDCHDDFGVYETWREALGIDPASVTYAEQSEGRTQVLSAVADYAGARLHLTGFGTIPGLGGVA
ncbi:hypothetical protein ACFVTP_11910 [Streptomyces celluloflavus]|uniref:hypothetical protein n=1 Tax=Streptomyces celluloflavus TaxID=58344 RepID=UPI0036DAC365